MLTGAQAETLLFDGRRCTGVAFRRGEAESATAQAEVVLATGAIGSPQLLQLSGVGPGDEVVVPSITFAASAAAVLYCGGTPVFADVRGAHDVGVDPADVEALRGLGVTLRSDVIEGQGGRQVLVDDPSGNPVELFEPA